jgi:ankyrin repeat protein
MIGRHSYGFPNGHDAVVKLLLSQTDIAINTQAADGATALMWASQNGHDAVVKLLLSQTDIAINTQAGRWLVTRHSCWLPRNGHDAVVKLLLLQTDIALNTQTKLGGWTALGFLEWPRRSRQTASLTDGYRN